MKIVIIGPAHPLRGGIASFNERIAQEFLKQGHEVILYTFTLQYPSIFFPGKTQFSPDPAPKDLDIRIKISSVNPFNWWRVGREIRDIKPDLVVCKFWMPFFGPSYGTILRIIKQNKHTKVIANIDNIIPHEQRIGDFQLAQYFTDIADAFIVMSKSVEEEMKHFLKQQPLIYIPHPIYDNYGEKVKREDALNHLNLSSDFQYLMFFGFIRDYKGLDLLIKALNHPKIRALNIKAIIAGEYYGNEEFYQNLIAQEGVSDLLELRTDYIPNDEVRYYFCAADLVVQPYKSATQSGISQLAYHFENPMVVTKVGGLPEIVEDGKAGYVVDVNPETIRAAILDFFTNNRKSEFQEGVKENKQFFSWDRMYQGFMELYAQVK